MALNIWRCNHLMPLHFKGLNCLGNGLHETGNFGAFIFIHLERGLHWKLINIRCLCDEKWRKQCWQRCSRPKHKTTLRTAQKTMQNDRLLGRETLTAHKQTLLKQQSAGTVITVHPVHRSTATSTGCTGVFLRGMWRLSTESSEQRVLVATSGFSVLHIHRVVSTGHWAHVAWTPLERLKQTHNARLLLIMSSFESFMVTFNNAAKFNEWVRGLKI